MNKDTKAVTLVTQTGEEMPYLQSVVTPAAKLYEWTQNQLTAHPTDVFPSGSRPPGLYNKTLMDVPFVIASAPMFRMRPATTTRDGRTFAAREEVQLWLQLLEGWESDDAATWTLAQAKLATIHGSYLCNQIRSMTEHELVESGIWTLAYNPEHPLPSSTKEEPKYPAMLARWVRPTSFVDESPYDGGAGLSAASSEGLASRGLMLHDVSELTGIGVVVLAQYTDKQWTAFFKQYDKLQKLAAVKPGASVDEALSNL